MNGHPSPIGFQECRRIVAEGPPPVAEEPVVGFPLFSAAGISVASGPTRLIDPLWMVVVPEGGEYGVRHWQCPRSSCAVTLSLPEAAAAGWGGRSERLIRRTPSLNVGVYLWSGLELRDRPVPQRLRRFVRSSAVDLVARDDRDREDEALGKVLSRAFAYLHSNPRRNVSLAEASWMAFSSPARLTTRFRRRFGVSLVAYHRRLRLTEGLRRICFRNQDLGSIAVDLGFHSHSHFTTRFREHFGVPPSAITVALESAVDLETLLDRLQRA